MFRLRIAKKVQTFQNKEEMVKAYNLAIKNNQLVEIVPDDEVTVKTEAEAVQSEVVEEGFSQDFQQAAPSANAEPTSIAQEDMASNLEDGSLESLLENQPEIEEIPKFKIEEAGIKDIPIFQIKDTALFEQKKPTTLAEAKAIAEKGEYQKATKAKMLEEIKTANSPFNVVQDNTKLQKVDLPKPVPKEYVEKLRKFETVASTALNSKSFYQESGVQGNTLAEMMGKGLESELRDYSKELFYRLNPGMEAPSNADMDNIVAAQLQKAEKKEIKEQFKEANKKAALYKDAGIYDDTVEEGTKEFTALLPANQQAAAKDISDYRKLVAIRDNKFSTPEAKTEAKRKIALLKPKLGDSFDALNTYKTVTKGGKTYRVKTTDYKMLFNPDTGEHLTTEEAAISGVKSVDLSKQAEALTEEYKQTNEDKLQVKWFNFLLDNSDLNQALDRTNDYTQGIYGGLDRALLEKGYKPDENGVFRGVRNEDVIKFRNIKDKVVGGRRVLNAALYKEDSDAKQNISTDLSYLNELAEERVRLGLEGEALTNGWLLNIDPGSVELDAADYVARFAESAGEATFGKEYMDSIGTTKRKELDAAEKMLMDSGIEITPDQEKAFERGFGMRVTEGLGNFVPALVEFGFLNKVAGAVGISKVIKGLLEAPGIRQKALGFFYGAMLEEAKFEAVTRGEAKTGGGAGFYLGGKFAALAKLQKYIRPAGQKVLGGAVGGVAGGETAKLAEGLSQELMGDKAWSTSMHEHFGDTGEALTQMLVDGVVFAALGAKDLKARDFYRMSTRRTMRTELIKELDAGKYKGRQKKQKQNIVAELDAQIREADKSYSELAIGEQKEVAEEARKAVRTGRHSNGEPLTEAEKIEANKTVNRYEANLMAAQRQVTMMFDRLVESGIMKGDVKLVITEGRGEMAEGFEGGFNRDNKTFTYDITEFTPGLQAHETFHAFSKMAFKNNPEAAKKFKDKIIGTIGKSLKGTTFTVEGKELEFAEAIEALYPKASELPAEEYVARVVTFLRNPNYKHLLLEQGFLKGLKRDIVGTWTAMGLPYKKNRDLRTAADVINFLEDFAAKAEGGSARAIKNKYEQFENILIDGVKLKTLDGQDIVTPKEMETTLKSSKMEPSEKKDIFSKATKGYEEMIAGGSTPEQAGVMVGYEMQPLIRKKLRSYIVKKGLEIPDAIVEDIVSDVALSSGKGTASVPSAVVSYTKGANLIKYIKENPKATPAEISKKAEEFGVRVDRVQSFVDLAKEGGEATMTSYVFGQLNNRILGVMQKPEYRDIFNTFSIDKNPGQIDNLAEGEGLGGGGVSDGYVDLSSPEQNVRINRIKAEVALKLPEEVKESINGVGERLLMSTPLKNLEAKQEGKIELPSGKTAEIVISKSEQATIKIEGEPTETIRVRSPKILEEKFGTGKKSFIKSPTTKEKLYRDAIDLIYPKLEKAMGGLKDNYTATAEYEAFIDNAYPLLKDYLSQSAVNKRFAEFKEPAIDKKTGKVLKKKTSAGGTVFTKKAVTLAEWRKYFIGDGSKRIDGRRRSLAEAFAGEFGFDSVMEVLSKESMKAQIESRQKEIGVELLDNYVTVIAKEIDRGNPGILAQKAMKAIKKAGGDPKDVFYDVQGNPRTIDEMTTRVGGIEGLAEIDLGLMTMLNNQLNTGGNKINESTYEKVSQYALENPKSGITPDMLEGIKDLKNASKENIENYEVQLRRILPFIPKFMEDYTFTSVHSSVPNNVLSALSGNVSVRNKITKEVYSREEFTKKFSEELGKSLADNPKLKKAWDLVQHLGELNNINSRILKAKIPVEPGGIEISRIGAERELADRVLIQEKYEKAMEKLGNRPTRGKKAMKEYDAKAAKYAKTKENSLNRFNIKYKREAVYVDGKIVTQPGTETQGITMLLHVENHVAAMNEINSRDISDARKIELIDALPSREPAVVALQLQQAVLEATLLSFGEARKSITQEVNGRSVEQQQQDMFKGLASMLINNYKGFRDLSPDIIIELTEGGIWQMKPEHLQSKAEFAANVLIAFNEGKLNTVDQVREVTSDYYNLVGERALQLAADAYLGITVENASEAKMLEFVQGQLNRVATPQDLATLKKRYNWLDKKSVYETMVAAQIRKATGKTLRAPKQTIIDNNIELQKTGFMRDIPGESSTSQSKRMNVVDKAFEEGRNADKKPKGISVFDFDDTLARTKSNVLYTLPDGTKGKLNATEFAKKSEALEAKGAKFDFSEFSKVVKGELGPLFAEAKKKEGKYTNKDIFVLTARPANSALAIHEFLKSEGLEIPMKNIVGLGDGAAKAKSEWMVGKVAEGYNDFYFADDAIKNVEAVRNALELFDVKSEVQQAIMASKKLSLEKSLAGMIERKKGIPADKKLSAAIASNMGRKKGRYDWFIPAAAEDFAGMMYKFYGKGKQGNEDMALIKETLIRPFNRAENAISTYKQRLGADYQALEKQLGQMDLVIGKETKKALEDININADQAARVFIYDKLGYDIPGLKSGEISNLVKVVNGDARLKAFAEGVMGITKTKKVFPRPGETWFSSNTRYELYKYATEGVRAEFLKEWESNVEKMFTEDNYARIEAGYGKDYVKNLKEMLSRMKTGKTRSSDLGKDVQAGMDYVNGSVGVIMFLNTRSAVLQTISAVNYVNWSDNNPIAIGKAVAKPKEWGKTFLDIYNSDFLKQRRGGLEINVEEAEIAKAVERSKGKARALYDGLIKIGFKPTQMADSFAIAFGGTPFLMNRTATYVKQGLTPEAAKKRAFEDFREVSEESQQSSRQDRVSNIQTGIAGRLIFAFANTPMQMTRMTKKATLDLAYGRGDAKTNISKILYYGAVQSYIFYALQQSQFLRLFGGDDEDMSQEQKDFNEKNNDEKTTRIANSMFDSFISGSGSPGKVAITAKNTVLKYLKEKEKGYKADYGNVINEALSISPPLSSKTKKIYSAFKTYKYYSTKQGQKELAEFGQYAFDNPMLMANAKVFSSVSNVPADRLIQKVNNLYSAFTDETLTPIQSAALAAGWDKWSLGLYDPKFMSEEEVATNKAARKEQLKQEKIAKKKATLESYNMNMSPEEKREVLKVLTKKEQGDSLRALGMRDIQFRSIMKLKEIDRIEKIISMQNKKQFNQDMLKISNTTRQDSLK